MADPVTNKLLYKTLVQVQHDLAALTGAVHRIDGRIAAMNDHLAEFYRSDRSQSDEIDELRGRVEALESTSKDDNPAP